MHLTHRLPLASGLLGLTLMTGSLLIPASASAEDFFEMKDGELVRPTGYREWVFIGTPLTPNDMNNGQATFPEFHAVYLDPESWDVWKESGEFRDGAIIVKELISVGSKAAASGAGYFMGDYIGLEASIKSSEHFPDEPGNWAYFSFTTPDHKTLTETNAPFPAAACNACHDAVAADDFVFTQYYPVLTAGKGAGEDAGGGTLSSLDGGE